MNDGREGGIFRLGCTHLGKEGVALREEDSCIDLVRSEMGWGGGDGSWKWMRNNGKGGRWIGSVVGSAREGIGFSVGEALPIDDLIVVGGQGCSPPGVSSGCCLDVVWMLSGCCLDVVLAVEK